MSSPKLHIQLDSISLVLLLFITCMLLLTVILDSSFSLDPGKPSNIIVSNISTSSMKIDWSTSSTKVVDFTTVNYTCANNRSRQNATSVNSIVLSNLTPGCNYSLCITIYSFGQTAYNCLWSVTCKFHLVISFCQTHNTWINFN